MLDKQAIDISFAQGLDQKTDPFRVSTGKFLSLQNSVFDKGGRLTKRNGYGALASLPDTTSKFLTTFNGNLTAIGQEINALGIGSDQWVNKGSLQPISLTTLPLIRSNTNQTQADSVVAPNGYVCTAYTDAGVYKYVVADSTTGQNIIEPTSLSVTGSYGTPRVFLLGNYFLILFTTLIGTYHLQYIAISISNPAMVTSPVDIATSYIPATTVAFDALVVNSNLYIAYNTTSGGQAVEVTYITSRLGAPVTPAVYASQIATMFTMSADTSGSTPIIYVAYYDAGGSTAHVLAVNQNLNPILNPVGFITSGSYLNLASTAQNGSVEIFLEKANNYSYDSSIPTHFIESVNITQSGTVGSRNPLIRSVGLASKAFLFSNTSYFLTIYYSAYQPSYFLVNGSGQIIAKLAYSNAGSYYTTGLPNAIVLNDTVGIAYLFKDLLQSINKTQGAAISAGVYSQTGINLVTFNMDMSQISTAEIGTNLNISGGFIAAYDGYQAVEQGFFVWPDNVELSPTTGGSMSAQQYFYQVTYEWSDNQGNIFRSAPSVPVSITLSGGNDAVVVNVPTLRLTAKTANPVKIVIYRWSAAQQNYYQVTSITSPTLNDPSVDSIAYTDALADSSIIGNNLIYTTGGVIEDLSPPSSNLLTIFNNRLWLVDAEDPNLLWFSKQVIEATPVEMSDLLTLFVPPSTSTTGSTGPITAVNPMDDKLIIFKQNAMGYINGIGPDNTGANNQYSDFVLINSVVGCTNQQSIVFTPQGLMFQSNKGIWLLGRDLSTNYIGASVEDLTTNAIVQSAVNVPFTNQVRFTLDSGITLLYDYYYGQWGTFTNVPAISSTIYQNLHTYINSRGQTFQETQGSYLDGSNPVLMSFVTGWINLMNIQGFQRFSQLYLLGEWISPFKLNVGIAYDYNSAIVQSTLVTPSQTPVTWGSDALWGSSATWGSQGNNIGWEGQANVFEARVFPERQKCETFQLSMQESFDNSFGVTAGAGLTLSGMNVIAGVKRGFRTSRASRNFG